MKQIPRIAIAFLLLITFNNSFGQAGVKPKIRIILADTSHRAKFGVAKLAEALKKQGFSSSVIAQKTPATVAANNTIVVGMLNDAALRKNFSGDSAVKKEGYRIVTYKQNSAVVGGIDNSGILYGCMELAEKINAAHTVPARLSLTDAPQMVMRGACIGVQKPYYLPGRTVYEYPYTPETFPWFYDKGLWIKYLDMMADNRMNALYLWNGHPFASLVRVKEYPYALSTSTA